MSSSSRKRKYSSRVSLLYLPDELLLNCLARVSRLYHPTLFLVSKRFRSLIASNKLLETRTQLGRSESCLYMCLRYHNELKPRWFTLSPRATKNPNPNPKESSNNVMVSIPTLNNSPIRWHDPIAVGSNIYMIGGINNKPLSKVLFMDCRFHTWHEAPPMQMDPNSSQMSVLDGKIYVAGSDYNSANLISCFDPKTQTWEDLPSLGEHMYWACTTLKSYVVEGKLYVYGDGKKVVYNAEENRWDPISSFKNTSFCVIDSVSYRYGSSWLEWYDNEGNSWRVLKGLEGVFPKLPRCARNVKLVNYGGNIVVLWEEDRKIWCAEIMLERRDGEEIYGNVVWCDDVFTARDSSKYSWKCVAVTL